MELAERKQLLEAKGKQAGQWLEMGAKKPKCTCARGKQKCALGREPWSQQGERRGFKRGGQLKKRMSRLSEAEVAGTKESRTAEVGKINGYFL